MNDRLATFDRLLEEALAQEFSGWDFAFMADRIRSAEPAWDYGQIVRGHLSGVKTLLDMGTGGGEFLASLQPRPAETWATEGYPPNVPVARARLAPLGVQVVAIDEKSRLPFEEASFELVINRHDSLPASELYRLLRPGGRFVTQQVGGRDNIQLNEWLQDQVDFEYASWTPAAACQQLNVAGLKVIDQKEDFPPVVFSDIGAVVFYLTVIAWQIGDFSVDRYRERLLELHHRIETEGRLVTRSHRFFIEAIKA